jgi:hypothetical protein
MNIIDKQQTELDHHILDSEIIKFPKTVGGYRFGKNKTLTTSFMFVYKPKWIHRFFMRILLDLHWFDI